MNSASEIVYVVDDDASVRKAIKRLIKSVGFNVMTFNSAQDFLKFDPEDETACLVLDIRMPGISGIELQEMFNQKNIQIPIIFISGHGNIAMSVETMKAGAVDFLEKPFEDQKLIDAIHNALERSRKYRVKMVEIRQIREQIRSLTPREYDVFKLVVDGLLNKQIASELGISEKTVKVHRARVMQKMNADSLADLVRKAEKNQI